ISIRPETGDRPTGWRRARSDRRPASVPGPSCIDDVPRSPVLSCCRSGLGDSRPQALLASEVLPRAGGKRTQVLTTFLFARATAESVANSVRGLAQLQLDLF